MTRALRREWIRFLRQWRHRRGAMLWRAAAVAVMLALALVARGAPVHGPFLTSTEGPLELTQLPPAVVVAPLRLAGAVVEGAARDWHLEHPGRPKYGEPVPVEVTAYCLKGTTRRGRYVRAGIVAADPRYFPLSRYIELYVGGNYLGRFLVDDTGGAIKGARLDVWTPTCREALRFGRQKGTAVLVPRPSGPAPTPDVEHLMAAIGK